jgi:hypothetical protein
MKSRLDALTPKKPSQSLSLCLDMFVIRNVADLALRPLVADGGPVVTHGCGQSALSINFECITHLLFGQLLPPLLRLILSRADDIAECWPDEAELESQ